MIFLPVTQLRAGFRSFDFRDIERRSVENRMEMGARSRWGRRPTTPIAANPTSPHIGRTPKTTMIVATTAQAQMLSTRASLSPMSPMCSFHAHPRPGSNRHTLAAIPSRTVPT